MAYILVVPKWTIGLLKAVFKYPTSFDFEGYTLRYIRASYIALGYLKRGCAMDIATFIGLVSGYALIMAAMIRGGSLATFYDTPSLLVTIGGTISATLMQFPAKEIVRVFSVTKNAFIVNNNNISLKKTIEFFVEMAKKTRKEGILSIEDECERMGIKDLFLIRGIQLAVDGIPPEDVRSILETELTYINERHATGCAVLDAMSYYAPAFGMVGTVIGLILMLKNLSDPTQLGGSMALALTSTFYGSILANLLFMPLSGKLKIRMQEETLRMEIILEAINTIQEGENPRLIEQKLNSFLAPKSRNTTIKVGR